MAQANASIVADNLRQGNGEGAWRGMYLRGYSRCHSFRPGQCVGASSCTELEQYVFIPVGLNSANDSEIMAIPGMSKRMVHEFEEYRPYKDMDQFRREIGKYVDDDEVARLESYVTLD